MDFLDDWRQFVSKLPQEQVATEPSKPEEQHPDTKSSTTTKIDRYTKRVYNNTYRNKHKHTINKIRRRYDQTPKGAYLKAKARALSKKQRWELSLENWKHVWDSCPLIFDDQHGEYKRAWEMRGSDPQLNTQMRRIKPSRGWIVSNVEIIYRNQPVPAHGIVAPWDWERGEPAKAEDIII